MPSTEFYDDNNHALRKVSCITRDNIDNIALNILSARIDYSAVKPSQYKELLEEYAEIVRDLQSAYMD